LIFGTLFVVLCAPTAKVSRTMNNLFFNLLKCRLMLLVLFLICNSVLQAKSSSLPIKSSENYDVLARKELSYPVEKIYIHFDRSSYFLGDDLWFKVYVVDGITNSLTAESKIVYVELIDPFNKIIESRVVHLENGGGAGEFGLDVSLKSGLYTVRAYTNYMRNFDDAFYFTKKMNINSFNDLKKEQNTTVSQDAKAQDSIPSPMILKPDLQFFPEGGVMVSGLQAKVGFKAINEAGFGIDVQGVILDKQEKELIGFKSSHLGMGSFMMVPENTDGLKARIQYAGSDFMYDLPDILESGVSMRVVNRGDVYQINFESSLKNGVNGLSLIGEQRGEVVCRATMSGSKTKGSIKVPLTTLDNGIVRFTLFDKKKQALCERLVFVETNRPRPVVVVKSSKKGYNQRELVELEVSMKNPSNLPANTSVAVTDMSTNKLSECDLDIRTYLLLNSEVRGEIESPCYYFNSKDQQRKRNLDLLLLTQGWRSYLWSHLADAREDGFAYSYESGIDFKGSIRSILNHDIPVHSDVALTYKNKEVFGHDEGKTFGEGRFLFPGYKFKDSISIIIEARKKLVNNKKKGEVQGAMNRDFYIVMDSFSAPSISFQPSHLNIDEASLKRYQDYEDAAYLDALYADQPDYVQLDGVEVKVARKPYVDPYRRNTMRYAQPRFRVDYAKENVVTLGNDVLWTFLSRAPGISKNRGRGGSGSYLGNEAYYYRGSRIVFFLDGVRFGDAASLNAVINANDVSFIDLLSGPQSTNYLAEAAVVVYTKTTKERLANRNSGSRKGIINFTYPGIYAAKEFYKPKYQVGEEDQMESDYRVTLHWEPTLRLNANGKAKISFYTADPEATYRIELEGVTLDGYPVRSESYFEVGN